MRAIASNMSPHLSSRHGPTLIYCSETAGGIKTVQTCVSAAAKTLRTTPTCDRVNKAIFTLLRCTTDELFFCCCGSVAAHFKNAATRQPSAFFDLYICTDVCTGCALVEIRRFHHNGTCTSRDQKSRRNFTSSFIARANLHRLSPLVAHSDRLKELLT